MEVKQIHEIVNTITSEILGESGIVAEDLSNIVDVGTQIFDSGAIDAYVKKLINHIGKVIFVNRAYRGSAPSVLMDAWEYGSVVEKISASLPKATENESWELEDGTSYDPNIFYKPEVSAKFFNSKVTFEIPISITEMQVKQSFSDAAQLNGFISMIYNSVDKAMTLKVDGLVMRTINNFIAETIYNEYASAQLSSKSGIRAINLLYLYKQINSSSTLTAANCIYDADFIRFAAYTIGVYTDRLTKMSTLFNMGGEERFSPKDTQHIVMLSDFKKAADTYLYSGTYHEEYVTLPDGIETVPYWQGSGTSYALSDISKINVVTADNHSVEASGILATIFDREALGVSNFNKRTTTNYNPKAEFFNNWAKMDAGYFNDFNEQLVVFFVA